MLLSVLIVKPMASLASGVDEDIMIMYHNILNTNGSEHQRGVSV